MKTFKNIAVGVHFREPDTSGHEQLNSDSEEAVSRAMQAAQAYGSKLCFVHVFEVDGRGRAHIERAGEGEGTFLGAARSTMHGLVGRARAAGIEATHAFLFGEPWHQISQKVTADAHDLVVVGSRRRAGFSKAVFGSTASRLMVHCPAPVLVVHVAPRRAYERIVVATDLSEIGEAALAHAVSFAGWNRSQVHVVHAVENWFETRMHRAGYAKDAILAEHEATKAEAHKVLTAQVARATKGVELASAPQIHVESGLAEEVIWSATVAHRADLLTLGMVGRTGWKGLLVGNTAERVLPEVACAVLSVRPEAGGARN